MRILVVEDDTRIAAFIAQGLRESGYHVNLARDGESGFLEATLNRYDLLVLDILLPKLDGVTLARKLRAERNTIPILMLTAKDTERDKIKGLDAGADDYLTKPFLFGEFLARVRALLRRDAFTRSRVMRVGDIELDTAGRRVRQGGRTLDLSQREYALLAFFIHHEGQVVTRAVLAEHVWGDAVVESNVIDVYVRYLRKKLGASLIETVRGSGYVLRGP